MLLRKLLLFVGSVAVLAASGEARADTIQPLLVSTGPTQIIAGTGYQTFTYNANLSLGGQVEDSFDFFQLTGILGFAGFTAPGDFSEAFVGVSGSTWNGTATTVAGVSTLRFEYDGTAGIIDGSQTPLVQISFLDIYNAAGSQNAAWTSQDHTNTVGNGPLAVAQAGLLDAPDPASGFAIVPLPMTAWSGLALFGLVTGGRGRRSRAA
jgi:hypothetical protein